MHADGCLTLSLLSPVIRSGLAQCVGGCALRFRVLMLVMASVRLVLSCGRPVAVLLEALFLLTFLMHVPRNLGNATACLDVVSAVDFILISLLSAVLGILMVVVGAVATAMAMARFLVLPTRYVRACP